MNLHGTRIWIGLGLLLCFGGWASFWPEVWGYGRSAGFGDGSGRQAYEHALCWGFVDF